MRGYCSRERRTGGSGDGLETADSTKVEANGCALDGYPSMFDPCPSPSPGPALDHGKGDVTQLKLGFQNTNYFPTVNGTPA